MVWLGVSTIAYQTTWVRRIQVGGRSNKVLLMTPQTNTSSGATAGGATEGGPQKGGLQKGGPQNHSTNSA